MPGIQPRPGETEAELNQRLLQSFGDAPYGKAESPEVRARKDAERERLARQAREELLFKLEARVLKRSAEQSEPEIPGLVPSRRFLELSQTLKNPQLLRDDLEEEVQQGRLSPYDLLDAERGLFDPTRREIVPDPYDGSVTFSRSLPSQPLIEDLLTYQNYIRAARYARAQR